MNNGQSRIVDLLLSQFPPDATKPQPGKGLPVRARRVARSVSQSILPPFFTRDSTERFA